MKDNLRIEYTCIYMKTIRHLTWTEKQHVCFTLLAKKDLHQPKTRHQGYSHLSWMAAQTPNSEVFEKRNILSQKQSIDPIFVLTNCMVV